MAGEAPKHGTFCWNELITTDVEASREFYSKLIGWAPAPMSETNDDYTVFKVGEAMAAGMIARNEHMGNVPPHWMAYITVDNVDETAAQVTGLGGQIVCPPTDIPNVGRFSLIQDPAGATVGIITFPKKD